MFDNTKALPKAANCTFVWLRQELCFLGNAKKTQKTLAVYEPCQRVVNVNCTL